MSVSDDNLDVAQQTLVLGQEPEVLVDTDHQDDRLHSDFDELEVSGEAKKPAFAFDPATGTFVGGSLQDEGGEDAQDNFNPFEGELEPEQADDAVNDEVIDEPEQRESDGSDVLDEEESLDTTDALIGNSNFLNSAVEQAAKLSSLDGTLMSSINNRAASMARQPSLSGLLANYCSNKIASARESRNSRVFEHKFKNLEAIAQRIRPFDFDSSNPESVAKAKEHFNTVGRDDVKALEAAYQAVMQSGRKMVNDYKSSSASNSSNLFQEQVLKQNALFIKEHESLLKCMKTNADNDKSLFDDFKGGLSGLFEVAKMALARLSLLLGAVAQAKGEQSKPSGNRSSPAPGMR